MPQGGKYPVFEPARYRPAETKARRDRLMAEMGPGSIGVFFTNPTRNRNNDVDFLFRGDSNFLYLTGFEEPDAALILVPDGFDFNGRRVREVIFVNLADAMSEVWLGYRMGVAGSTAILGIEAAAPNTDFATVLAKAAAAASAKKLTTGQVPADASPQEPLGQMVQSYQTWRSGAGFASGVNGAATIRRYRQIKSAWEIELLKKACAISAQAHTEAMRSMSPSMWEYQIAAVQEFIFKSQGCDYTGYPSICGSEANATILHYEANRRQMRAGELFLTDSAGEYYNYSADVTRTYPVNGKFSPEQKAIYEIVLAAQEKGIGMCRVGATMGQISQAISAVMADGLIKLGVIKNASELGRYYMHGFGHGIGLDVHDPSPQTLAAGAALTVEPGIYIKAGSPCNKKWWNIGVRIEDDILVTEAGPVNMSAGCPRKVADIEKLMAEKGIGNSVSVPWKG